MSDTEARGRQWLLRLQSAFVLPIARGLYLLIAVASLVTVIGGLLYVAFLQASVTAEPTMAPVPEPFTGAAPAVDTSARSVDLNLVGKRLAPPTNLRFVVDVATVSKPLQPGVVLGYFAADTPNALAPFPDGVSLLGGRDAPLFDRVADPKHDAIGLAPRAALIDEIAERLRDGKGVESRPFEIRVVARDRYGIASEVADLVFSVRIGVPPTTGAARPVAEPQRPATELEKLAGEIAEVVEPTVNPARFDAYRVAVQAPSRCGTTDADRVFLGNYRRAFEELRPRLTAANVEAFYLGLCEAWNVTLRRESAEREQAQERWYSERRAAEQARAAVEARNHELLRRHAADVLQAKAQSVLATSVVGVALVVFLSVALILAFLAIEGHSRAVRVAIEAMVRISEGRKTGEVVEGAS
jgi:hypothetical protein